MANINTIPEFGKELKQGLKNSVKCIDCGQEFLSDKHTECLGCGGYLTRLH